MNVLNQTPDYNFLNQVIDNIKNIEKKDMNAVVKEIYDATYYRYAMMYHEAEAKKDYMRDIVIRKTEKIDQLQQACAILLDAALTKKELDESQLESLTSTFNKYKEDASS